VVADPLAASNVDRQTKAALAAAPALAKEVKAAGIKDKRIDQAAAMRAAKKRKARDEDVDESETGASDTDFAPSGDESDEGAGRGSAPKLKKKATAAAAASTAGAAVKMVIHAGGDATDEFAGIMDPKAQLSAADRAELNAKKPRARKWLYGPVHSCAYLPMGSKQRTWTYTDEVIT
jgi:hypothetical protein